MVTAMSAKTDVVAIRLIGEEVVRLLSLSDADLDEQALAGAYPHCRSGAVA